MNSKLSPMMFLDNLFYDATTNSTPSLNQMAISVKKKFKVKISKQGITKRYTASAIKYVQSLIGQALSHQLCRPLNTGWLKLFKRILVKDSTKFDVSENLANQFPGSGGNASKAGVSIQYEFDIKSGEVTDLTITPANRADRKDTSETINKVRKGDLIIRDLGYSILNCFMTIKEVGAYFLSRLDYKLKVYEIKNNKLVELDFVKLHQVMTRGKIPRLNKQVFIGQKEKFPVRIIIELMPEEIVNKRLKKVNSNSKKKGYKTSSNYKTLCQFNLFITNIEENIIETEVISKIYKIRWQVELIFKAWKSVFGIDNINPMKYERLLCLLNARLLLIIINWSIFIHKRAQFYFKTGKLLSLNKCFKTLHENSKELRDILTKNCKGLKNWLKMVCELFETHHCLEKKKNKLGLEEILHINALQSDDYCYI